MLNAMFEFLLGPPRYKLTIHATSRLTPRADEIIHHSKHWTRFGVWVQEWFWHVQANHLSVTTFYWTEREEV